MQKRKNHRQQSHQNAGPVPCNGFQKIAREVGLQGALVGRQTD
jgi:hypothetical protein